MNIVVIGPKEDDTVSDVLLVNKEGKTGEDFEKEWDETIDHLNKLKQDWQVDDVIQAQQAKGWQIIVAPHTFLTY